MAAAGLAVLETILAPGFLDAVAARAGTLGRGLAALSDRLGLGGERGAGLLRALVLPDPVAPAVVEAARTLAPEGLLVNAPRPNLLRLMPALDVTDAEIALMLTMLESALRATGRG